MTCGRVVVLVSICVWVGLGVGCKPPPPPMYTRLPLATFKLNGEAEQTLDGITISVAPITGTNASSFAPVYNRMTATVTADDGSGTTKEMEITGPVVPFPAFEVRIVNNTGHVIRFTTAVFRLEDNTGKTYPTFASTAELQAWNQLNNGGLDPQLQTQVMTRINAMVSSLQLLNRTVEMLKGDQWAGYLVFNYGGETDYYNKLLTGVERFKLRIAEVPVETDEAGTVVKTTEFAFVIDRTSEDVDVECPGDTAEPSWDVCTRKR